MEIKRYMDLYKEHSPEEFFNWMAQGKTIEVRFLSDYLGNKFKDWYLIKNIAEKMNLEYRYNSLFVNSWQELRRIILFVIDGKPLTKLYNIFIGANPRRKVFVKTKNGLLVKSYYGGIAGVECIQNVICDIEHGLRDLSYDEIKRWHESNDLPYSEEDLKKYLLPNATEDMLEECINGAKYLVDILKLTDYAINISGNGVHLWIKVEEPILVPLPKLNEKAEKTKYILKEEPIYSTIKMYNHFVERLNTLLKKFNPKLKVDDGAKDIARIARHPGTWNIKKGKTQRAVGTVVLYNKLINNIKPKILAAKPVVDRDKKAYIKQVQNTNKYRYNYLNIRDCPLYKLLIREYLPSIYSRNHYLEMSFARIIRDNNINLDDIQNVVNEINIIQRKDVQVDPDYIGDEEPFNSETVNSYCVNSLVDLVYPILEEVPEIEDGNINDSRYNALNSYSLDSIKTMAIPNITKPNNYLMLKNLIRKLVDEYSRAKVFYTIKVLLYSEWEYYDRNRVIQQILNKTRRRLE